MKQIAIILILVCIGCSKEKQEKQDKYFDPKDLNSLKLETIIDFWGEVGIKDTSYYMGMHFEDYPGFIKGVRLVGVDRAVWISLFDSQDNAVSAMEARQADIACVIQNGNSDSVNGKWWYSRCTGTNIVFVNQWNAIVEIDYNYADFEGIKNVLYDTANEIAERVDKLSSVVE